MTTHILLQCSKNKSLDVSDRLVWSSKTKLVNWKQTWENMNDKLPANEMYNGRTIKKEFELLKKFNDIKVYIISAGGGLIPLEDEIPSYEATFSPNYGPLPEQWSHLPHGGLEKLEFKNEDTIVSFAAPKYHKALLHDIEINHLASRMVVANTSPLSTLTGISSVEIHPRTAEYLKIALIDLNSELLKIFLKSGTNGFNNLYKEVGELPPPAERASISDNDLLVLIQSLTNLSSITKTVHHLRHTLNISASYERIRGAILEVRSLKQSF